MPYQPIGTGYNRSKGEYGFTGVLEDIKSNNLFQGEFNNRTADQVKQGVLSGAVPRTGWNSGSAYKPPSTSVSGAMSGPAPTMTNPLLGGQTPSAAQTLMNRSLDDYDQLLDLNNDGVLDPWEMMGGK